MWVQGGWVNNKEHGKGLLMTGDRQIIYTGTDLHCT
jgi:hypothetical protein